MRVVKDFDTWNSLKKHLNISGMNCFYHEREVWWCSLGINIGFEEDGKGAQAERPVLVLKGFSRQLCWIVPLSTSSKRNRYNISVGTIDGKSVVAMISHLRPIDTKRFINRIGYIDQIEFEKTKLAIKDLL